VYNFLAAQIWLLGRILPIMIGEMILEDNDYSENILVMVEIVDILLYPQISEDVAAFLHCWFTKLYPDSPTTILYSSYTLTDA